MMQTEFIAAMAEELALETAGQLAVPEALYRALPMRARQFQPTWHALGLLAYGSGQLELAALREPYYQ